MGLFGARPQARDAFPYPVIPPNSQVGVGGTSFTQPNMHNAESAMRKVAVFASVNLIAGLLSSMPLDGYTGQGVDKRQVPLPRFFDNPDGSGQGMSDWLYQLLFSWLLRGNAYGLILDRDAMGRPSQVQLQHPDRVSVRQDTQGRAVWTVDGKQTDKDQVWHRRVYPVPGRILGLSPIELHATTIGQGIAAANFGLRWFTDGGHPSAILQNENAAEIDQVKAEGVKARFLAAVRGTREPVVLARGWKYQQIQINPDESQFLDTQKYTAAECARIYGPGMPEVLGYETGGSMTYTNVEQRSLDLLKFTLNRWFRRAESVLSADVLSNPRYVKFNRAALLETDLLTRYRAHAMSLQNRWEVVNGVRHIEDLPPVPWGDVPNETGPKAQIARAEELT